MWRRCESFVNFGCVEAVAVVTHICTHTVLLGPCNQAVSPWAELLNPPGSNIRHFTSLLLQMACLPFLSNKERKLLHEYEQRFPALLRELSIAQAAGRQLQHRVTTLERALATAERQAAAVRLIA